MDPQVVLGSDFPFDMGLDDPVRSVAMRVCLPRLTARILGGNADALLETLVRA